VTLGSHGAQGIIDRTAADLRAWQAERERQEAVAVGDVWTSDGGAADLRVEVAMEGVTAYIDGRWQEPKVATILVRRLEPAAEGPTLGGVLTRRYVCMLGAAEDLAVRIK
jgi:hypothetical protein